MLTVKAEKLELRGVMNQTSAKTGKVYYILHTETSAGEPHQLFCPEASALPQGLKKGDLVNVTFDVQRYKQNERLVVAKVERAS